MNSHEVRWEKVTTPDEAFDAIKSMKVRVKPVTLGQTDQQIRGAPAIASLAALSLRSYLSASSLPSFSSTKEVVDHIKPILDHLQSSRPTAVNLSEAMNRIRRLLSSASGDPSDLVEKVKKVCTAVHEEDLKRNMTMGRLGAEWLWKKRGGNGKKGLKVLTVCNTGSLATSVRNLWPFCVFY